MNTLELYTEVTSKLDKRGEQEYRDLAQTIISSVNSIEDMLLLSNTPLEDLLGIEGYKSLEDKTINKYVLLKYLSLDIDTKDYLKAKTTRVLVIGDHMHELPLNSATSMLARSTAKVFHSVEDMQYKKRLVQGDLEYKLASILLYMFKLAGAYTIGKKAAVVSKGQYKHSYDLVHFNHSLSENLSKYIMKRESIEASTFRPLNWSESFKGGTEATTRYSGHAIKYHSEQLPFVWTRLNKLQSVAFTLNESLIQTRLPDIKETFAEVRDQDSMLAQMQDLVGQTYHFSYNYGPDNGRIYGNGYYVPSQQGGRNWMSVFASKHMLTTEGRSILETKVADYENKGDPELLPAKKKLEYLNYVDALAQADRGEAIGHMVGMDGIIMGPQTIAIALRDAHQYYYSVIEDGRKLMAQELNLTPDEVKGGISPYNYGAGKETTIKGILGAGDQSTSHRIGDHDMFFVAWERSFGAYFPASLRLRQFINAYSYKAELTHRVDYTTLAGFNATITPIETLVTHHHTVFGKTREHSRKDVVDGKYGSKILAAYGHQLDSSMLAFVVDRATYDLKPVHDEYCVHANNVSALMSDYAEANTYLFNEGGAHLNTFVNQVFSDYVAMYGSIDTSVLMSNTLNIQDLVAGLN